MCSPESNRIVSMLKIKNKKNHKLKGWGLINFKSRISPVNAISNEIKLNIEHRFGIDKS